MNIAGGGTGCRARCITFGAACPFTRPSDQRPPAMYGHFCLVPRVSAHDRYYCSTSSSLGSRCVLWLGKGLSMSSPNYPVLCCPLPYRVAPVFVQVVSPPLGWSPLSSFLVIWSPSGDARGPSVVFEAVNMPCPACHARRFIAIERGDGGADPVCDPTFCSWGFGGRCKTPGGARGRAPEANAFWQQSIEIGVNSGLWITVYTPKIEDGEMEGT